MSKELNDKEYGWIDAGVNLLDPRINNEDVLARCFETGVSHLLVISSTFEESIEALKLKKNINQAEPQPAIDSDKQAIRKGWQYPIIECTVGIHPHHADKADKSTISNIKALCVDNSVRVIGECGLDFNRNFSSPKNQLYAFEAQLELAAELGLGVYLHERDAFEQQVQLLEKYSKYLPFKVAHCFTGTQEQLQVYLALDCYIGITGWICDAKRGGDLRSAVLELPLEKMLLETDSPYLFPKTVRPKKSINEPCYLPHIAKQLANLKGIETDLIKQHTFRNSHELFFG